MTRTNTDVKRSMKQKVLTRKLWVLLIAALLVIGPLPVPRVRAASYTVNTLADNTTVDGSCTLREAILGANNDASYNGDCGPANAGDDTITFSVAGTIYLNSGLRIVAGGGPLTINGSGRIAISGDSNNDGFPDLRAFNVDPGATLNLQNLTVTRCEGFGGPGGLQNNGGTVTITNCTFSFNDGNNGGGLFNRGTMTVTNSTLFANSAAGEGGGLMNFGTVMIINSTFFSNGTGDEGGGGLANSAGGTVMIMGSTFFNNAGEGSDDGGAILNGFRLSGGGGPVTITNSTFVNNRGGAIVNLGGPITIVNSTFSGNDFGIRIGNMINIKNSIVVGNGPDCLNAGGTLNAVGTNFDSNGTCAALDSDFMTVTSAQINLGPLQNNGGSTPTRGLLSGSVAIDAASDCTLFDGTTVVTTDQRGVSRPQGAACDVGAYEAAQASTGTIIINKVSSGGDGTFNFTGSSGLSNFSITTSGGMGSRTFSNVPVGTKTVMETVPSGWTLTSLVCTPSNNTTVNLAQRKATINLAANETVTCTFTNTKSAGGGGGGGNGSLFTLQGSGGCLTLNLQTRQYIFKDGRRTIAGIFTFSQSGQTVRFQSADGDTNRLSGSINLSTRTASATLILPLSLGGGRYTFNTLATTPCT